MTSRERVALALDHKASDRTPVDFGGTSVTGLSASFLFKLRRELGFKERPIRVYCPYQLLGEVDEELRDWIGVDVIGPWPMRNLFGFDNTPAKDFTLPDGTPVQVPEAFNTQFEADGRLYMYAEGDRNYPPSAVMPSGGYYFDTIIRQQPIDDDALNVADNLQEFARLSDEALRRVQEQVNGLYRYTQYAIIAGPGGTGLGDVAYVAGPMLKDPKGVRDIAEWYMSPLLRPEYVKEIFEKQTAIALDNLKLYHEAVGDKIAVINLCGADFGNQNALMSSVEVFREFYLPYYRKMTGWIHQHTKWKVFKHSCGAVAPLIDSFIEAGIDILNPVQCSAAGMAPQDLKDRYGSRIVFWGGGVDTQRTLPLGTEEEVRFEVAQRLSILGKGGGYIFNAIHNIQANVPVKNFIALVEALKKQHGA